MRRYLPFFFSLLLVLSILSQLTPVLTEGDRFGLRHIAYDGSSYPLPLALFPTFVVFLIVIFGVEGVGLLISSLLYLFFLYGFHTAGWTAGFVNAVSISPQLLLSWMGICGLQIILMAHPLFRRHGLAGDWLPIAVPALYFLKGGGNSKALKRHSVGWLISTLYGNFLLLPRFFTWAMVGLNSIKLRWQGGKSRRWVLPLTLLVLSEAAAWSWQSGWGSLPGEFRAALVWGVPTFCMAPDLFAKRWRSYLGPLAILTYVFFFLASIEGSGLTHLIRMGLDKAVSSGPFRSILESFLVSFMGGGILWDQTPIEWATFSTIEKAAWVEGLCLGILLSPWSLLNLVPVLLNQTTYSELLRVRFQIGWLPFGVMVLTLAIGTVPWASSLTAITFIFLVIAAGTWVLARRGTVFLDAHSEPR